MIINTPLPIGWSIQTLGDLFEFKGGGTPDKKNPSYWNGDISWASVKDIKSKYLEKTIDSITEKGLKKSATNLANPGDLVLLTRIEPGKITIVKKTVAVNQDCKILKLTECVDTYWAYYIFLAIERDFIKRSSGTTVLGIRLNDVKDIPILMPPLNEQKRIVTKIEELFSELDNGIAALKTAREQLKVYRQAVLKHAFEGKLTAQWRQENALSENLFHSFLKVEELVILGPSNGRSVKDRNGGFPVLRLTALKNGKIDLREFKEGDWSREEAQSYIVKKGDFLLSRGNGSKHLVGRGGLVPTPDHEVAFPDTMVRIRLNLKKIEPIYFSYAWESRLIRAQIENSARTTAGIYKINQQHIKNFSLPVPSLLEQKEIVRILEEKLAVTDVSIYDIGVQISKSEILRQSILKKAFSGRLVSQDPNDEPASALLARIQAEKAAQEATRQSAKTKTPVPRGRKPRSKKAET